MKYLQAKVIRTVLIVEMGTVEELSYFIEKKSVITSFRIFGWLCVAFLSD